LRPLQSGLQLQKKEDSGRKARMHLRVFNHSQINNFSVEPRGIECLPLLGAANEANILIVHRKANLAYFQDVERGFGSDADRQGEVGATSRLLSISDTARSHRGSRLTTAKDVGSIINGSLLPFCNPTFVNASKPS
jgi:hypothetical protein